MFLIGSLSSTFMLFQAATLGMESFLSAFGEHAFCRSVLKRAKNDLKHVSDLNLSLIYLFESTTILGSWFIDDQMF